jgi:biopolymer transport protein ExbB/TolQ
MLMQKLVYVSEVGASAVLYVLIALSVVSIGVIIERWWYFRKRRFNLASASTALAKSLRAHDVEGARSTLKQSPALEAAIIGEALESYEDGPESLQEMLQKAIRQRRKSFEGGLLFLGTLGNNAPFVGLFGTVLGVVAAFRELGNSQAAMANGGGMGNVMGGIAEALIATGIGIMVALPAVISYNIFQKKGADVEEQANALGNIVMAAMKSNRVRRPSRADQTADEADEGDGPGVSRLGAEA